jgi:hypothetical protein
MLDGLQRRVRPRVVALGLTALTPVLAASALQPAAPADARAPAICSGPGSAHRACRFTTPSGNIRCIWTPRPNSVSCVLLRTGRAYRLRPSGHAKALRLALPARGRPLPLDQQLVFPQSLSCHDTRTTMTCNQDFGLGSFKLAPTGSHRS